MHVVRFALIFPSVINEGENIYCILSHAVIQFSLFIVRCDQKWIYRDSNYFELHINWILFRQARNQTMWQKSLTLYLTGAKVQQLFQSEKALVLLESWFYIWKPVFVICSQATAVHGVQLLICCLMSFQEFISLQLSWVGCIFVQITFKWPSTR